jgi:hypothetical protein
MFDEDAPQAWGAYDWLTANGLNTPKSVLTDFGLGANSSDNDITAAVEAAEAQALVDSCELAGTREALEAMIEEVYGDADETELT